MAFQSQIHADEQMTDFVNHKIRNTKKLTEIETKNNEGTIYKQDRKQKQYKKQKQFLYARSGRVQEFGPGQAKAIGQGPAKGSAKGQPRPSTRSFRSTPLDLD